LDELNSDEPVEGCLHPAKITSIEVKDYKPKTGNVASNAIDGDVSTRWATMNRNKWMELSFDGGEDGTSLVEGVAIAFFRGDRRVAFFDLELYNEEGQLVAARKHLGSSGLVQNFEMFTFDNPVAASTVRITPKGTTAGAWNGFTKASGPIPLWKMRPGSRHALPCLVPVVTPLSGLTFVGCFEDDKTGGTRHIGESYTAEHELTPISCSKFCAGYKYMGLQSAIQCFCGNTYYTADEGPKPSDQCVMPCGGDEDVTCGGDYVNSVYILGNPDEKTEEEIDVENAPHVDDGVPRRQFKLINNCNEQIRVGATGGFVKKLENEDESCPVGSELDLAVGACFWALPFPEDARTFDLKVGGEVRFVLDNEAKNGVRWSGNLWGATGCETTVGCETATCLMNEGYPDGYCPPSTGPTGPVTKAEFTLASSCRTMHFDSVDYYDVSAIDGVNLPMEMKPDPESSPQERDDDCKPHWCSNPGGTTTMSEGLEGCTWHFNTSRIEGFGDDDMSKYLRWVRNDGSFTDCDADVDCKDVESQVDGDRDLKCGALYGIDTSRGGYTKELFPKKCGSCIGWHSANKICGGAHGKPMGYFPNSYPFMCEVKTGQVDGDNSTQSDIYGCAGPYYGLSGYSKDADDTACGCPDWVAQGIQAPASAKCHSNNPYWEALSLPWLKYIKKACPTAYCFPYDDHSSTFVCANNDEENTHDGTNSMSYIITFCPGDSQTRLFM
ncbi:unnamed protein product, partial [Ascophyllum nodosum]